MGVDTNFNAPKSRLDGGLGGGISGPDMDIDMDGRVPDVNLDKSGSINLNGSLPKADLGLGGDIGGGLGGDIRAPKLNS